jgi:hypothetical protein
MKARGGQESSLATQKGRTKGSHHQAGENWQFLSATTARLRGFVSMWLGITPSLLQVLLYLKLMCC